MVQAKKNSALLFLFVFTAYLLCGGVATGFSYQTISSDNSGIALKKVCENSQHSVHFSQPQKNIEGTQESPDNTNRTVRLVSCNSCVQILPASNSFFVPDHANKTIQIEPSFLASQIFVFQEPHPPRRS